MLNIKSYNMTTSSSKLSIPASVRTCIHLIATVVSFSLCKDSGEKEPKSSIKISSFCRLKHCNNGIEARLVAEVLCGLYTFI